MEARKLKQIELHRRLVPVYQNRHYLEPGSVRFYEYWNESILQFLPKNRRLRVLDCGTGLGLLLAQALKTGHEGWGYDLSLDMMRNAEEIVHKEGILVQTDGECLPFKDNSFDAAVCRGMLHHMENWEAAIRDVYRVLRPGGRFVISEPCDQNVMIRMIRRLMYIGSSHFDEEDFGFSRKQLRERFAAAGFQQIAMLHFGFTAYAFAGFPDKIPIIKSFKNAPRIVQSLTQVDKALARTPVVRRFALQILACFEKPGNA